MKKTHWLFLTGLLSICFFAYYQMHFAEPSLSQQDSSSRSPAQAGGYCIALRGNGELEPAHWGALARTVEQLGLPTAMAGGSSATISMFLMEAIAAHPLIHTQPPEMQKQRASLLLKSFLAFFNELQNTKTWADLKVLFGEYQKVKNMEQLNKIGPMIDRAQFQSALAILNKGVELGAVDVKSAQPLFAALRASDARKAQFYWQQLVETAKVFGKFNAAGDDNLFFRAGIASFENAAVTFGKVAAFYAVANGDAAQTGRWQKFFDICSANSKGQNWIQIATAHPDCTPLFHELFQSHFSRPNADIHPEEGEIGQNIAVFPTTTVLTGSAATEYREALNQYHQALDPHFGKNFRLSNAADVRFGYWGQPESLQKISQALDTSDEKSRKFLALGKTNWKTVLSLSPAEPGLSPLKEFTAQGQNYISAGGWSDLHPVLVLKAAGCDQVVYLTRQGGESLFAQGIAKRLLNLDRDWSLLNAADENAKKLNNDGDPNDMTSVWSRLYNLANPNSSVNRSLSKASAILCTNWNAFEVQKDFLPLIEDSYRSSYWINPEQNSPLISAISPVLQLRKPGCQP